jgi:hypothetical protein
LVSFSFKLLTPPPPPRSGPRYPLVRKLGVSRIDLGLAVAVAVAAYSISVIHLTQYTNRAMTLRRKIEIMVRFRLVVCDM